MIRYLKVHAYCAIIVKIDDYNHHGGNYGKIPGGQLPNLWETVGKR